ncbi:MAG: histidinol phosphate phosphatase domain-containing protein [Thermoplasmata archaeon]
MNESIAGNKQRCDFHTHSLLSDGELLPIELIRRCVDKKYKAVAITDHVSLFNAEEVVISLVKECELAMKHWDIIAIPGVEITHVPPAKIAEVASLARKAGAKLVNVHGETPVEPVPPGTNSAAIEAQVDVLCHPGFITEKECEKAKENGVYLEITSRHGHSYTNGHVAALCSRFGNNVLINSDTHEVHDLITYDFSWKVARGAGLSNTMAARAIDEEPLKLLKWLGYL